MKTTQSNPARLPDPPAEPPAKGARPKIRKPFLVMCRFLKLAGASAGWECWHVWKRYATAEDRDRALATLTRTYKGRAYIQFTAARVQP